MLAVPRLITKVKSQRRRKGGERERFQCSHTKSSGLIVSSSVRVERGRESTRPSAAGPSQRPTDSKKSFLSHSMWQHHRTARNRIIAAAVLAIIVGNMSDSMVTVVSATSYLQQVEGIEAATDASPAAVASLSYYCSYDTCQCSADLRELTCRGVSFTRVPAPLPTTLVKL